LLPIGAVGEHCSSYANVSDINEGSSEFARRPIASKDSGDKKTKQKAARRVRLFWLLFWQSKKVACSRQPRANFVEVRKNPSPPYPSP
jgi:hypothetical protein